MSPCSSSREASQEIIKWSREKAQQIQSNRFLVKFNLLLTLFFNVNHDIVINIISIPLLFDVVFFLSLISPVIFTSGWLLAAKSHHH
jgi:hypothetical protein